VASEDVALRCNLALAQAARANSSAVKIEVEGHARAVVRHALLRGLICTAARSGAGTTVEISGPLALFRRTALYGRHLAELLPMLAWTRGFRLAAECIVTRGAGTLVLDPSSPLMPSSAPRRYDSKLEERFARDFLRLTSEWNLVREPEPVPTAGTLIFPDFALVHRRDPARRFLLEILGFWTADYVATKLRRLRAAGLTNLILCIDAARDCGRHELPRDARVLRFERRVDAARVLETVEGRARSAGSPGG
jgi:predicted nuclease of restriction endonuclease-like RecB superfamily